MRTYWLKSSFAATLLLFFSPLFAAQTPTNLTENASTLAAVTESYMDIVKEAEEIGHHNERTRLLQSLAQATKAYKKNLDRYFGFRIMSHIYSSKIISDYKKIQKIHRENHDPRYDKAHQDFEKAYKGWEKLHSAFKHYKGHFL